MLTKILNKFRSDYKLLSNLPKRFLLLLYLQFLICHPFPLNNSPSTLLQSHDKSLLFLIWKLKHPIQNKIQLMVQSQYQEDPKVAQVKKHIQAYGKADDRKAWMSLGISVMWQVVSWVCISLLGLRFVGWFIHWGNTLRIFVQFHDLAHCNFFTSLKMNIFVGKLLGIYQHYPYNAWRDGHNHHHKHFGNLDRLDLSQTILFTKKQYEAMKGWKRVLTRFFREPIIYFFITVPFVWFFGLFYVVGKRYGVFSWSFFQKIMSIVFWGWFLPKMGIPAFQLWLCDYLTQVLGTVVFHMEHSINPPYRAHKDKWTFQGAALQGSTFLKVPFWFKDSTCGIEYHHIHHLNTSVPSYQLKNCHEEFELNSKAGTKWDDLNIHRIDLGDILMSFGNVMYDEETDKLVPFNYTSM